MKLVGELWLPDGEEHLLSIATDYQGDKRREAMKWVRQRRTAIDVGAHCGLWSRHLAPLFLRLHAFEPVYEHRQCFEANVPDGRGSYVVMLYSQALGEASANVAIKVREGCSGDAWISGSGAIPMQRLDYFDIQEVDFLKIDCCGYELPVLHGARETLERCKPCVCVEQKPGSPQRFGLPPLGAVKYLERMGALLRLEMSGVYVLSWP